MKTVIVLMVLTFEWEETNNKLIFKIIKRMANYGIWKEIKNNKIEKKGGTKV